MCHTVTVLYCTHSTAIVIFRGTWAATFVAIARPSRGPCTAIGIVRVPHLKFFVFFWRVFVGCFFSVFSEHHFASILVTFGSFLDSVWELLDVFFWCFSRVWKKVPLKRFFTYFLVLADPREPKYSLSQTQFCANQR